MTGALIPLDAARRQRALARLAADTSPAADDPRSLTLRAAALLARAAERTASDGQRCHLLGLADEAQRVAVAERR